MNKPKFIMVRGLPGSGKSTWANEYVKNNPNAVKINRDDIRLELFGTWDTVTDDVSTREEKEKQVSEVEHNKIQEALKAGKTVVNDNTNLYPSFLNKNLNLAKLFGADISVQDFNIPIEECLRRNANREKKVPKEIIEKMARNYLGPNGEFHLVPEVYPVREFRVPDSRREAIIFDADGTLWDTRSIVHYVADDPSGKRKWKDFDMFHRSSLFVPPNPEVLAILREAEKEGLAIIIVTARNEPYRAVTQAWLDKHNINYENIYMREQDDRRKDYIVKQEILEKILKHYDVVHAVDDRESVIENAWKPKGITTTLVPGADNSIPIGEVIKVKSPFVPGICIRCGSRLQNGAILGPTCAKKS